MEFKIGYTPTADDAYMLYGLLEGKVDTEGFSFAGHKAALPELNNLASRGSIDITMISAGAWPMVAGKYAILNCAASFGFSTGPVVVTRNPDEDRELSEMTVAIPGATTTAQAMLRIYLPEVKTRVLPLAQLLPALETGLADAALLIHEEFVTAKHRGLHVIADLGKWWMQEYKLPMPVTLCVVNKEIPETMRSQITEILRKSIKYAFSHHDKAIDFAMEYSRGQSREIIENFVSQYVNDLSINIDDKGKKALETFFKACAMQGIL